MNGPPTRRRLVAAVAASALAAALRPGVGRAGPLPRFVGYPFMLGVASGYPTPGGFTLWTRLAPAPLSPDGGMPPEGIELTWEVAGDEAFTQVVAAGTAGAFPEHAHAVRVDVAGLQPARWYHYRFRAGHEVSPVGRTRTADAPGSTPGALRFGVGSCQHFEHGYYAAHRHLAGEGLDLMLFLGDYIYEASWGDDRVRQHLGDETITLADYRVRYGQYRSDPDLQALHAAVPWLLMWDDHEVDNDWAAGESEHLDPRFLLRRAAAFQAFFEHMPLPASMRVLPGESRLYHALDFGDLARFAITDDRQYRDPQPCPDPAKVGGSRRVPRSACPDLGDPRRTMLGQAQEAWLDTTLTSSRARWNVLATQSLLAPRTVGTGPDAVAWTDGWDGYPAARQAFIERLRKRKVANPLVVGGDIHATVVADIHLDPENPDTPLVASEVCGTSISSQGITQDDSELAERTHPHLRYVNNWQRGYVVMDLTPGNARMRLRTVNEKDRHSDVQTTASFVVEAGRPGWTRA